MDDFLTVNEIADDLKVERKTVVSWIASRRLRAFKPGGGRIWRVSSKDFQRFISEEKRRILENVSRRET